MFAPISAILGLLFFASTLPNGIRLAELPSDGDHIEIIAGYTSSGLNGFFSTAAARAFLHILRGTYLDPDIFVLAQVTNDDTPLGVEQLQGVDGIPPKVKAIAETGRFAGGNQGQGRQRSPADTRKESRNRSIPAPGNRRLR